LCRKSLLYAAVQALLTLPLGRLEPLRDDALISLQDIPNLGIGLWCEVGVPLGHLEVRVAQELAHDVERDAALYQERGEGVAK